MKKPMTSEQIKKRNADPVYQTRLKAWRKANRARINLRARLCRYNLTLEQYEQMKKAQNNLCKICLEPLLTARNTHVDHHHGSGRVRALLCGRCNTALGHVRESQFILQRTLAYLRWTGEPSSLTYAEFADLPIRLSNTE